MLEKPDIEACRISACLLAEYGLGAKQVVFLPLGADVNTAVYRVAVLSLRMNRSRYCGLLREAAFE